MKKPFLFTPGPTPVPERILTALAKPLINHRSQEFKEVIADVRGKLKLLFRTQNEVLILTSSGTGAMEGAVTSLFKPNDSVVVVDAGKFGERFAKITKAFGLQTDVLKVEWGKAVQVSEIEKKLTANTRGLCIQASETSTGTYHPVQEISQLLQKKFPDCLLIVDGITAVGAMPIPADDWKIDVLISGSQKALMLPPGLAFASLSTRALTRMKESHLPQFYFSFQREYDAILENQTAFTPSISLVMALRESLTMLLEEGLENVFARHSRLAKSTRAALVALGFKLASDSPSVACTAAYFPAGIDGKVFLKKLRELYGFTVAGGQDQWEGKAIRLSHLGYYTGFDLMNAIAAIGRELERELKKKVDTAGALGTFMETFDL